jgi:hypothetical protein
MAKPEAGRGLPEFPCPMCGEVMVTPLDLYTCQECGRVGCEACVDLGFFVCQACLDEYDEELEEEPER